MKMFLLLLFVVAFTVAARNDTKKSEIEDTMPPGPKGKSFFLFGAIFRKFRQRLLGYHDPTPLFAGPTFPLYGYYNCPIYGCNPTMNYHPAPYENPNYYHYAVNAPAALPPAYGLPQQPQQQTTQQTAQQQSNVVIYQRGQEQPVGYYPPQQALPALPSLPPPPQPPAPAHPISYGANGFGGGANLPPFPPVNNYGNYVPAGPAFGPPVGPPYSALPAGPSSCGQQGYMCNFRGP